MQPLTPGSIALLGGSFDPPHKAHSAVVQTISGLEGIDRIIVVPCGHNPMKGNHYLFSYADRLAMTRIAMQDLPHTEVSSLDAPELSTGYTIDLIDRLRTNGITAPLCFVIGADLVPQLPRWKSFARLASLLTFLIVNRPGYNIDPDLTRQIDYRLLTMPPQAVSSTIVRSRLYSNLPVDDLVSPGVAAYIASHPVSQA